MSVVDWRTAPYDVYIGRFVPGPPGITTETCIYGNPFVLNDVNDDQERKMVITQYQRWLYHPEQAWVITKARKELCGKVLACWCKPKDCHGDVLLFAVNATQQQIEAKRKDLGLV